MTSKSSKGNVAKPSFAKVAAMAPPNLTNQLTAKPQPERTVTSTAVDARTPHQTPKLNFGELSQRHANQTPVSRDEILDLSQAVQNTRMNGRRDLEKGVKSSPEWTSDPSTAEDQHSQVSRSSTKQSSVDGKSAESALTFAMDEKESIRPDDSASVQAIDEESLLSGAATASSHTGLDNGALHQVEEPTILQPPASYSNAASVRNPDFASPELPRLNNTYAASEVSSIAAAPDEKLLEAMSVPKDRLLLLSIEEKILAFIQSSKEPQFELPLQNSFARLLAHKLADYYNLLHIVGGDNNSVVLYRNSHHRLPPSISMIAGSLTTSAPLPTGSAAVTIMRRAGVPVGKAPTNSSTPMSSSAPSKATSETGADTGSEEGIPSPSEGCAPKDKAKMSREEREAKYKSVRDRIFGDIPESSTTEASSTGETSAAMSRSSSASGKKKGHKQRTPKDDSFEARSQFNAWYPTVGYSNQQQPPIDVSPPQSSFQQGQLPMPPGSSTYPISYGQNATHTYIPPGYDPNSPFPNGSTYGPGSQVPSYDFREGWSGHQPSQGAVYFGFSPNNQTMPGPSPQPSAMPSPGFNQFGQPIAPQMSSPQPTWMQQPYQVSYPQSSTYPQNAPIAWPSVPGQLNTNPQYSYGQYSSQPINSTQYASPPLAHPASYQSSSFNPQTRSFIPASGTRPTSRNVPSRSLQYATNNAPISHVTPDNSFSSFRQPSSFASSPQASHINHPSPYSNSSGAPTSPSQEESLKKKWGTPAHLPKKPPPSEVPSAYDLDKTGSLPSQKPYPSIVTSGSKSNAPLVVSGGSGYSMVS